MAQYNNYPVVVTLGPPYPASILQNVIKAYPYVQYQDDPNIVAWFIAYNTLAQAYLQWFNQTPFGVYTSPNVSGQLLDWIGKGIYGIVRPVFAQAVTTTTGGALDANPVNNTALNQGTSSTTYSGTIASDDFYKRTITWHTYLGDGRHCNTMVLRKKIARFLFGVNGSDVTVSQAEAVSISPGTGGALTIHIPTGIASTYFQEAIAAGILDFPFQLKPTISIP